MGFAEPSSASAGCLGLASQSGIAQQRMVCGALLFAQCIPAPVLNGFACVETSYLGLSLTWESGACANEQMNFHRDTLGR